MATINSEWEGKGEAFWGDGWGCVICGKGWKADESTARGKRREGHRGGKRSKRRSESRKKQIKAEKQEAKKRGKTQRKKAK